MCHLQHPGNGSEKSPGSCAACCCFSDWLSVSLSLRSCWSLLVLAGVSYPIPYRADQYCGTGLASNFCGWWSKEGAAEIRTNSAGFRDREHRLQKPEDVLRVAVLGDSYIEAFQVSQDEMFASVLEAELKSRKFGGDRRVEVLSFGVSDFGTAQELLMLCCSRFSLRMICGIILRSSNRKDCVRCSRLSTTNWCWICRFVPSPPTSMHYRIRLGSRRRWSTRRECCNLFKPCGEVSSLHDLVRLRSDRWR
jgi:hypothetical protein